MPSQQCLDIPLAKLPFYFQLLRHSLDPYLRHTLVDLLRVLWKKAGPSRRAPFEQLLLSNLEHLAYVGNGSQDLIRLAVGLAQEKCEWISGKLIEELGRLVDAIFTHQEHQFLEFVEQFLSEEKGEKVLNAFELKGCRRCFSIQKEKSQLRLDKIASKYHAKGNKVFYSFNEIMPIDKLKVVSNDKFHNAVTVQYQQKGNWVKLGRQPCESTFAAREIMLEFHVDRLRTQTCNTCKNEYDIICGNCGKGIQLHATISDVFTADVQEIMKDVKVATQKLIRFREKAMAIFQAFKHRKGSITPEMVVPQQDAVFLFNHLMTILKSITPETDKPLPQDYTMSNSVQQSCYCCLKRACYNMLKHLTGVKLGMANLKELKVKLERVVWSEKVSSKFRKDVMVLYLSIVSELWNDKQHLAVRLEQEFKDKQAHHLGSLDFIYRQILQITSPRCQPQPKPTLPSLTKQLCLVRQPGPRMSLTDYRWLKEALYSADNQLYLMEVLRWAIPIEPYWNCWIYEAIKQIRGILDRLPPQKLIEVAIEGLTHHLESFFISKCLEVVTPRRKSIILKMDAPMRQLKEYERQYGRLEHPMLTTKEVNSDEVGYCMQDLHDWICRQIKISPVFDLLVGGKLVDDLSVTFQSLAKKFGQDDMLRVIYRLRGVMGQASQQMIGLLPDQKEEVCIKLFDHFANPRIISLIFESISRQRENNDLLMQIMRLLNRTFQSKKVAKLAAEDVYLNILISQLPKFNPKLDLELIQLFISAISTASAQYVEKGINRKKSGYFEEEIDLSHHTNESIVPDMLSLMALLKQNRHHNQANEILRLLPFCSKDHIEPNRILLEHFKIGSHISDCQKTSLEALVILLEHMPQNYETLRFELYTNGFCETTLRIILTQMQSDKALLPFKILKGAVKGCNAIQQLLHDQALKQIFDYSQTKDKSIQSVTIADAIIHYLAEGDLVEISVQDGCKRLLAGRKTSILQRTQRKQKGLRDRFKDLQKKKLDEEKNIVQDPIQCVICREGYSTKQRVLGLYLNSSKVWTMEGTVISSVTSFNAIHLECHIKHKENQWDVALKSNGDIECNNWVPIPHSNCPSQEFAQGMKKYRDTGLSICSNNMAAKNLMSLDLRLLLNRLSNDDFKDSKSTFYHNIKLLVIFANILQDSDVLEKFQEFEPIQILMSSTIKDKEIILKESKKKYKQALLALQLRDLLKGGDLYEQVRKVEEFSNQLRLKMREE